MGFYENKIVTVPCFYSSKSHHTVSLFNFDILCNLIVTEVVTDLVTESIPLNQTFKGENKF